MKKLSSQFITLTPEQRLYQHHLPLIGLTGGIATGKSTVTKILRDLGIKVIDADQLVKSIYQTKECRDFIKNNFPEAWEENEINFPKLRELFFLDLKTKATIESFIYTRLPEAFRKASQEIQGADFCVYDVPLLFEKHLDCKVDLSVVVYAPRAVQVQRLRKRDHLSEEAALRILEAQMDIEEKKKKADLVIENEGTPTELTHQVEALLKKILA